MQVKFLSCIFLLGVRCAFRKDADDFRPMEKCFTCCHYLTFVRELEEEEDEFFAFADDVEKYGLEEADRREELRKKKGDSVF